MFHVPVRVEDEAFPSFAWGDSEEHVARNGIEPHQPVGARKHNHLVVRDVDDGDAVSKASLLPKRVAVVEGDRLTDGPGTPEKRGGHVLALAPEEVDQHNS